MGPVPNINAPAALEMLADLATGARFLAHLPRFLRRPLTVAEARRIVHRRLETRQTDFLALVARHVYRRAGSPYHRLLQLAGCDLEDLARLVREDGIEGALQALLRHGVYLTVDEFKGRRPVIRGTATIEVRPDLVRSPSAASHARLQTGGSRGVATPVPIDLAFARDRAVNAALVFEGWGGADWRRAFWGIPGGAAIIHALEFSILPPGLARWFSTQDVAAPGLHPRYRWSVRALRYGSLLAARPVPGPVHVPPDDPRPILAWMAAVLREGAVPHLHTFASAAAGLCQAALDAGIDLSGARFTMGGEPTTAARLAVVRKAGAEGLPLYSSMDSGLIGYGCRRPGAADDCHLLPDFHAAIQPGADGPARGLPPRALLLSSLRDTAPYLLLNVSLGDQAVMQSRACECPLEQEGWPVHLQDVRSFEKLTAAGMTFLDADLVRVLEEVLPHHFGGGPTDYQVVEEESATGRPLLRLLVHPRVGVVDPDLVADAFLGAISIGSGAERVMGLNWRATGMLRVERRPPIRTGVGKILHLHVGAGVGESSP